ncbi:putative exported protein [Plasmodium gaboni]|uniref:Putative exported protein n=1 Tax=Plasmodium gaboni TaxID=647221 RepID=A0A151L678_9APIC|nr:putative exported protein [Plasmodium gaboni]KYN94432.1 putative exported protein [Plasmodium gaboni]
MIFIYFKILFFSLLLDTFISSHTNIPRTNHNNSKNAAVNKTPVNTIPDVITLDYIKEQLKQIQLIKDEIIKDKLKKIKFLKKKYKSKNKNDHNDIKEEIEKLEKEILDTKILCEDYIKNELKEISLLKDEIVKDKIERYHWKRDKLIDYELNRLFYEAKKKKIQQLYDTFRREKGISCKIKKKEKRKEKKMKMKMKMKTHIYIYIYIYSFILFYFLVNKIKKKRKKKTFFELWSSFYEIMEEKVHKYQLGGYTIGIGIIAAIAKSIHSIVATPMACIKESALTAKFIAGTIKCCKAVSGAAATCGSSATAATEICTKCVQIVKGTVNIICCTSAAEKCCEVTGVVANCCKLKSLQTACATATASPDPATKVVAIIIIVILVIILIVYLYFLIKKSGILENEKVQKVISKLEDYYMSQQVLYII